MEHSITIEFVCWLYFLKFSWIHLLDLKVYLWDPWLFFTDYDICKQWKFIFLFFSLDDFISSSCLITMAKGVHSVLNKINKSEHFCLVSELRILLLCVHSVWCEISFRLLIYYLYYAEVHSFCTSLIQQFYHGDANLNSDECHEDVWSGFTKLKTETQASASF